MGQSSRCSYHSVFFVQTQAYRTDISAISLNVSLVIHVTIISEDASTVLANGADKARRWVSLSLWVTLLLYSDHSLFGNGLAW